MNTQSMEVLFSNGIEQMDRIEHEQQANGKDTPWIRSKQQIHNNELYGCGYAEGRAHSKKLVFHCPSLSTASKHKNTGDCQHGKIYNVHWPKVFPWCGQQPQAHTT